ncbi:MAG: hypothetical protein E6Y73_05030 [Finegoldia magna]|nr:hypothetical protein [uncultured Finegoldia sp.]MDU5998886.1 hypothetical protein [Finegoldia magna]
MLNTHENNIKAEKMLEEYYKKYLEKKKKSKNKKQKIKPKRTK